MSIETVRALLTAPPPNEVKVGVVGVTGAVGQEMLQVMLKRGWQPKELKVRETI